MSFRERFTEEEWQVLMGLPAQLLMLTGLADGEFDPAEREEANQRLQRAAQADPDPLYRELAAAMFASGTSLMSDVARADPERCRQLLRDNLTTEEYQHFFVSVLADGLAVAKASGARRRKPFGPKPDPISDEEKGVLAAWTRFYGFFELG